MANILKHIATLDSRRETNAIIAFVLRCWQASRFLEPANEMRVYLQRANHAATAAHRRNLVHLKLYALTIFIAIEAGNFDGANAMLDKAMSYKSFLKAHEPYHYGTLCFLYAYLELKQGRTRSAKKHRRLLTEHMKTVASVDFAAFSGLLALAAGELSDAQKFFERAYNAGCRSVFLFDGFYHFYKLAPVGTAVFLPIITYAAERGADISSVMTRHAEAASEAVAKNPEMGEKLYAASGYPPLLQDICTNRISRGDMSAEAFAFYLDAEKRQVYMPGIFDALIRAAYENNAQKLNRYTLKNFLSTAQMTDPAFAVYVYHFLITDPALSDLLPDAQAKILQFGTRCLEGDFRGREANSVYLYLWNRFRALGITGAPLNKAEEILRENLTLFELRLRENSAVKFIYVTEPEKRGMEVREVSENPTIIEAVSGSLACTCLGAGKRAILDEEVIVSPMISGSNASLYHYFFQAGDRRFHVLAYLSSFYLGLEAPPADAVPVFEAILAEKIIPKPYRMRILVALGRLHYEAENFDRALEYYGEVDESAIGGGFIRQALDVYLQTGEYTRAGRLISAKYKHIPHESLFEALAVLITKATFETDNLAAVCYDLLINNFFDEKILAFVLKNFRASYSEWSELSKVIDEDNRLAPALDARLLQAALEMSRFDEAAQKAFVRFFENPVGAANLTAAFTELATFEILANSTRPEYDVITILEKIYSDAEEKPELLALGLAGVFLRHGIKTLKSDEIIADALAIQQNAGILLPVFKESPDIQTPYTHKFQPFVYKSLPEKNCRLYYRISDSPNYMYTPMQYMKYGLYVAAVPMFFGETFTYYFSEESDSGSVTTKEQTIQNTVQFISETNENADDPYFIINNAIVSAQNFKHDQAEKLISGLVRNVRPVRAILM
ncbi:MAG: DUF5717 family protein [Defluviitaleaceae bacterium]|nr:DUF5717 family protein [Defluviitaleaceae bacterium]